MSKTIAVSEIFKTVQGEGKFIGTPTIFVRTGGCDYRCSWCDTLYAVLPEYKDDWKPMDAESVFREIRRLSPKPILLTLSGGNPALQPFKPLLDIGHHHGYTFCMETQGSTLCSWRNDLDYITVSPKPPSSGMKTNWKRLDTWMECVPFTVLKMVIFDDTDYSYAQEVENRYPHIPVYLQPGNATPSQVGEFNIEGVLDKTRWLIDKVVQGQWNDAVVLPQLHTLLWANQRGI